jgi:hypothetical protein
MDSCPNDIVSVTTRRTGTLSLWSELPSNRRWIVVCGISAVALGISVLSKLPHQDRGDPGATPDHGNASVHPPATPRFLDLHACLLNVLSRPEVTMAPDRARS